MATKKQTATETTDETTMHGRAPSEEQQIAVDDGSVEPSDINSSLDSDRMKALLEEHRAMGTRP